MFFECVIKGVEDIRPQRSLALVEAYCVVLTRKRPIESQSHVVDCLPPAVAVAAAAAAAATAATAAAAVEATGNT